MTNNDDQSGQGMRLESFINSLNIKAKAFAKSVSVSQSLISQVIGDKKPITHTLLTKITARYSNANAHWLLTGEGEMFLSQEKEGIEGDKPMDILAKNIALIRARWGMEQIEFAELFRIRRFTQ